MLAGNITAISVGAIFAIVVSLITRPSMTKEEVEEEWEKTREIDNPLSPWVQKYKVRNNKNFIYLLQYEIIAFQILWYVLDMIMQLILG